MRPVHEQATQEGVYIVTVFREGLSFKELQGSWKGEPELSLLIPERYANFAKQVGIFYEQDAILYLNERREAWFADPYDIDNVVRKERPCGVFRHVPKNMVDTLDNVEGYTFDPSTGNYYLVV